MTKVRVGTTAKGVFAVVSALLVVTGTLIGVRNTSMQEASALGEALCEQQARDHARRFLTATTSWEGVAAVPADPGSLNTTLYVFRDLPGFWKKVEALDARQGLRPARQQHLRQLAVRGHVARQVRTRSIGLRRPQSCRRSCIEGIGGSRQSAPRARKQTA